MVDPNEGDFDEEAEAEDTVVRGGRLAGQRPAQVARREGRWM